jgi:hypothetical protein
LNNSETEIQFVLLQGICLGYLYYNPLQEYDEVDEYYEKHQIMFIFFGVIITIWKEEY